MEQDQQLQLSIGFELEMQANFKQVPDAKAMSDVIFDTVTLAEVVGKESPNAVTLTPYSARLYIVHRLQERILPQMHLIAIPTNNLISDQRHDERPEVQTALANVSDTTHYIFKSEVIHNMHEDPRSAYISPLEITTPAFVDTGDRDAPWKEEIKILMDGLEALNSEARIAIELRTSPEHTGLHVHVGRGLEREMRFSLEEVKKVALVVCMFEEDISQYYPASRVGLTATRPLFFGRHLTMDRESLVAFISGMATFNDFVKKAQPNGSKQFEVNFTRLARSVDSGTIEFRQQASTLDPDLICSWGEFVLALIRGSCRTDWEELTVTSFEDVIGDAQLLEHLRSRITHIA